MMYEEFLLYLFMIGSAYLAQSPQLYKQIAISGDFGRVFTVGGGKVEKISPFVITINQSGLDWSEVDSTFLP